MPQASFLGALRSFFSSGSFPSKPTELDIDTTPTGFAMTTEEPTLCTTNTNHPPKYSPSPEIHLPDCSLDSSHSPSPTPELIDESPSQSPPDNSPPNLASSPSRQQSHSWVAINEQKPKPWGLLDTMIGPISSSPMCATKIKSKPQVYSRPRSVKAYSIYHVLHQYQTTSLHVRPISWSDQHAKIFKVEWDHLERSQHPTPNITLPTIDTPQNVIELSQHLSTLFTTRETTPYSDLSCVMSILWRLFPDRHPTVESRPDSLLPFWLGGRPNNSAVKLQAVWELSDNPEVNDCSFSTESTMPFDSESTSVADTASFGGINDDEAIKEKESPKYHARPVMAYVSRDRLNLLRHGMFRIPAGPKRCANMPVINLHRKRAIKLRPAIPDEDMYLAAAFISMAQRYFYPRVIGSEKSFDPEQIRPFEDVKLRILVSDAASEDFIVYTTTVTKELLSALHNPRTLVMPGYGPLSAMSSLKITTQHVAARPIYGLRERLGKALGDVFGESFGEFPGIETELWGEDSTLAQSIINQARPPWGANPRPSINTARNQEQLVRRQLKLKATPGLKRRASERERAMRKDDTENKSRHEPLVLPFPPMPEGQEQKAPPSLKRKEGDGMSELHEEETVRVKRRRSMAL